MVVSPGVVWGGSRRRRTRQINAAAIGFAALLAVACSGSPSGPSATVTESVSGVWIGKATLTAVSGGECVGPTLASAVGSRDMFAASIKQAATDLTATVAYQGNRTSCALAGRVNTGRVGLDLASCHAGRIERFSCSNGAVRELAMLTDRLSAASVNGTGTGSDISTWNVFEPGGSVPVGVLTVTADFRWNISRLPHDDFHIFDGSILPGYVDGVVTIPEEPDPFCTRCGWF
jgi:hypothetical protein